MDSQNDTYNHTAQMPPPPPGRSPWVATAAAGAIAVVIAGGLIASSGSGSAGAGPMGGGPPTMPKLPTGLSTDFSTKMPNGGPGAPTGKSTGTSTRTPTGAKHDWNTAAGDKSTFTAAEWFGSTGSQSIQGNSYNNLAQQDGSCMVVEPNARLLMNGTCIKVIRSVWANSAKTHVGALSVVSLKDNTAASAFQRDLTADKSKNDYVQFINPPAGSGVQYSNQSPSWISMTTSGHYVVIVEVARSDGKAKDSTSMSMTNDLRQVAIQHINAIQISGG